MFWGCRVLGVWVMCFGDLGFRGLGDLGFSVLGARV